MDDFHYKLERALAKQHVPLEILEKGFRERPRTFKEHENMLQRFSRTNMDPESIMYNATYLSIAIVASILLETTPSSNIIDSINEFSHYCIKRLQVETLMNTLTLPITPATCSLTLT